MNHDDRFTDALDAIAAAAGDATSHLPDDALVAGVRRRATVLRRRRATARAVTAAAVVTVVVAGGAVAAQQLGGRSGPAPAVPLHAACGTTFTPPTPTVDGLHLALSPSAEVLAERGLTHLPDVVAALDADAARDAVTLTSDGNVEYTVVKDGRVVANGGAARQPLITTSLTAGGPASSRFVGMLPVPCDPASQAAPNTFPSGTLPAGTYEVWATIHDARLHAGEPVTDVLGGQPADVVGGPWTVTLGDSYFPTPTETLACGASANGLAASSAPGEPRLTVTAPRTMAPTLDDAVEARIEVATDDPRPYRVDRLTSYLLDGDAVVAVADALAPHDLDLDLVVAGADARARVPVTTGSCDGARDLSGPLTLLVVADVTDLSSSSSEGLTLVSERQPVTLEPQPAWEVPDDVAPTMAYSCPGPTADDTAWIERSTDLFSQSSTRLRLTGTTARTTAERGTTLDVGASLTVDGTVLADGVQAFLLQDGSVVARAHTPTPGGTWTTFPPGPGTGGIDDWPAADVPRLDGPLSVDVPGRSCAGTLLPAGDYELVVGLYGSVGFQVEVTVVKSLGTITVTD